MPRRSRSRQCGADFPQIVAFAALITEIAVHPPVWVHLVLWLPATLILCLVLLRPMKGVLLAAQFKNKASEARHG